MKFRKLGTAWSLFWGLAAVLLIVLWARSYIRVDKLWRPTATSTGWIAWTFRGRAVATGARGMRGPNELQWALSRGGDEAPVDRSKPVFGFSLGPRYYSMPIWFPALLCATFTAIPYFPWSRRFSLRTLLIATTLLAVVLGLIVYAVK
jgi:hypothetical protein